MNWRNDSMRQKNALSIPHKSRGIMRWIKKNLPMTLFVLPGFAVMLINNYAPMLGLVMAFKRMDNSRGIFGSPFNGFSNFGFLFKSNNAFIITRNTVLYNLAFILIGLVISLVIAIALQELRSRMMAKVYQTIIILPYFLSFVVIGYIVYGLLSPELGFVNRTLMPFLGKDPVNWYSDLQYWPFILVFINCWVYCGINSIIYSASITSIDMGLYESAVIDGASKWKQIRFITLPMLYPVISVLTLISLGNIFRGNFGLFYQVPLANPLLIPATDVLDTYIYRSLSKMGDLGMATAASLYQSVLGCFVIVSANLIIKKINPDNAMF